MGRPPKPFTCPHVTLISLRLCQWHATFQNGINSNAFLSSLNCVQNKHVLLALAQSRRLPGAPTYVSHVMSHMMS